MKVKKLATLILALMMIISIVLIIASCAPDNDIDDDLDGDNSGGSGAVVNPVYINMPEVFNNISEGLRNAGSLKESQNQGTRFVSSKYNLRVGAINTELTYQANYNLDQKQDSEILLRVFDYASQQDKVFVYYADNDLYYSIEGKASMIRDFGGTSAFAPFYEIITNFDFGGTLFESKTVASIDAMRTLAESKNITKRKLGNNRENVTIKNINLDTSKEVVNSMIQSALVPLGQKVDPLTELMFGFKFSSLASFSIERFTVRKLEVVLEELPNEEKKLADFTLIFDDDEEGKDEWGSIANDYFLSIEYLTEDKTGDIELLPHENPQQNIYTPGSVGDIHLKGTLDLPGLDSRLYADLKLDISTTNNNDNRIKLEFKDKTENLDHPYAVDKEIIASYYKDGILYADLTGFMEKFVGTTIDLPALNFPKLQFASIDVTSILSDLITYGVNLFSSGMDLSALIPGEEQATSMFNVFLSKLESKQNRIILRIDDELVSGIMAGESDRLIDRVGDLLGLSRAQVDMLIAVGIFDNSYLELSYDTITKEFLIVGFAGGSTLFSLSLYAQSTNYEDFDIVLPVYPYFENFKELDQPEVYNLNFDMLVSTQKVNNVDFSAFMGLFIGDVSGKNTPLEIRPGTINGIRLLGEIASKGKDVYINMQVLEGSDVLIRVNTNPNNTAQVLVDNRMLGVKYIMPSQTLLDGIDKLAGGKSTLNFENAVLNLPGLAKEATYVKNLDEFRFELYPYTEGKVSYDPMKRITGISNLIASAKFKIFFGLPEFNENINDYHLPNIASIPEVTYVGMYDAVWKDKVSVVIGEYSKDFYLTFDGDSATLENGQYEYHPTTYLFGRPVTYSMYFSDQLNGTRKVINLKNPFLLVDPAAVQPLPDLMEVIYEDGTIGRLAYRIENFPYNNANIKQIYSGVVPTEHRVIIGEGSIAETKFDIIVEVLNSTIVVPENKRYNDIPIVAKVIIDPYDYAIKRTIAEAANATYNPIRYREEGGEISPTTLELVFESNIKNMGTSYRKEYAEDFDWKFDLSLIDYKGGEFTWTAKYKNLPIALEVIVLAKIASYIQINDEANRGYYTVDALREATYSIPATSIYAEDATPTLLENELRIYFESGHFRIIGTEPEGFTISTSERDWFDGFYPGGLDWTFKVANQVTVDRAIYPLDNGKTNKTKAFFGDDFVGKQTIELTVTCPTRVIGTLPDTLLAITEISYDSNGKIISETVRRDAVKISSSSFNRISSLGSYFEFDPYNEAITNTKLPDKVWLEVIYRGRTQKLGYDVTWLTNMDGTPDNIIDAQGNILNALAEEEYFVVYGRVGTLTNYQILTMIIHNKSGAYERVIMLDENEQVFSAVEEISEGYASTHYFIKGLNPYQPLVLPTYFILQFSEASGIPDTQYETYWVMDNGQQATQYDFPYQGGNFVITTKLSADTDSGMLDQTIELNLQFVEKKVVPDIIFGVSSGMTPGHILLEDQEGAGGVHSIPFVEVNTYLYESSVLYQSLVDPNLSVGVLFQDETSMESGIDIEWENLEELLAVLKSPLGSRDIYNNTVNYLGDFVNLRGKIAPGTAREQSVSMAFRVGSKIIRDFSYMNLDNSYAVKDDYDVIPVHITQSLKAIHHNIENGLFEYTGENIINITLNKPYMLRGTYIDANGDTRTGVCTPAQYIEYLFSRIAIGFEEDLPAEYAMIFELREDFDDILFFKKNAQDYLNDDDVSISSNLASIRFVVTKLGPGSCEQSFIVTVNAVRDHVLLTEFTDRIETFDNNGVQIYGGMEGYTIPGTFSVEYQKSGVVEFEGLVWRAADYISGTSYDINVGDIVTNIPYEFFKFKAGRIVTVETRTHDGTQIIRRLSFNQKDIREVNYNTTGTGLYNIKDGVLTINNVYQIYPVVGLENRLSTRIVPKKTENYFSEIDINFELDNGWIPTSSFALSTNPTKFDPEKLAMNINYSGLAKTLFATGTITGYNGEKQEIKLYLQIQSLDSGGRVSNESIGLVNSLAAIDPYLRPSGENGNLVIPKEMTIRFGEVSPTQPIFTFSQEDNIYFEIKNKDTGLYEIITSIPYNKFGHALGLAYGGENEKLTIRIVLPDGNKSCSFEIGFLRRDLSRAFFSSKVNGAGNGYNMFEGRYFIDPYDSSTFFLPETAEFEYIDSQDRETMPVSFEPFSTDYPFVLSNGRYLLDPNVISYAGGEYYFYGYLPGIGEGDAPQYYILLVMVLNRTVEIEPISITQNNRTFVFSGTEGRPNPFEGLVSDIPSSLATATFNNLIKIDTTIASTINSVSQHIQGLPGNSNVSITHFDFAVHQTENIYADYLSVGNPTLPNVKWFIGDRPLVDDDILVNGGFSLDLVGVIGYGSEASRTKGQDVTLQVRADLWSYQEILGITNYIIEFSKYSNTSIAEEFYIKFLVGAPGSQIVFLPSPAFYPVDKVGGDSQKMRKIIDWGNVNPASTITSSITLRNAFKTNSVNIIKTEAIYNLDYQQIGVDEISFGFGPNEGYNVSSSVYITIDPLNPIIPLKAKAKGLNPNEAIYPPEVVNIGDVTINWIDKDSTSSESIYNIPIAGGKRSVEIEIIDSTNAITPFTVQVYYLNRTVKRVYTKIAGYSRLAAVAGEFLLMERQENEGATIPSTKSYYLDLDPVNANVYTANSEVATNLKYLGERSKLQQSLYKLPSSVRLEFYNVFAVNPSMTQSVYNEAIGRLGVELNLTGVDWVISRDVELIAATAQNPITAKIRGYVATHVDTIAGEEKTSTKRSFIKVDPENDSQLIENAQWLGTSLNINLTTVDRMVQYTSISEGVTVEVAGVITHYQEVREGWYIDPYDIKLPEVIDVYFKDQAMYVRYGETSPINWQYDASYLKKPEIISGSIVNEQPNGERFMTLMAEFRAYGTKVSIQFKIKARNIDTKVVLPNGQSTTEPLKGGTIFVLKGIPIASQLPTKLYYRFTYPDGSSEIAEVPLFFDANKISGLTTAVAITDSGFGGEYSNIAATLGTIDDNNILFNIVVIDPKLYGIKIVTSTVTIGNSQTTISEYQRINFITDKIAVGVSRGNAYTPGPETSLLPNRIIVTNEGDYIEVDSIAYDIARMKAVVTCAYTFLSFSDNASLFGNGAESESDAKKLMLSFEVPITTYQYTAIEQTEAVFQLPYYTVPLGTVINASSLPKTINGISPLWVLDDVNTNMAGRYVAKCYFKNAYGIIVEGNIDIIVQKKQIKPEDVTIDKKFLDRVYTSNPMDIEESITFANFLRSDGKLGQIQGYTVQYSIDGGATWMSTQPVNVPSPGSPNYRVKIVILDTDDYNITGSVEFRLNISRAQVEKDKIFFHTGDSLPLGAEVTFEYTGSERVPAISGIPEGVNYQLSFAYYVEGESPVYSGSIRPINAGKYYLNIRFNEDQRNYDIEEGVSFTIIINITKRNVIYSLETILDYTGNAFNVPINGLPSPIPGDITVTYTYYDILGGYALPVGSRLRNAGQYRVDVAINGGLNYPSYNVAGAPINQSLLSQIVTVLPKQVRLKVGALSTNYLDPLLPLNSALRIVDANDTSLNGLQGTDEIGIFGNITVKWSGGNLTYKYMVGEYELMIDNFASVTHTNYEIIGEIRGQYSITATLPNTRVIDNKSQLDSVLSLIKDGETARLYLRAGNYGTISLNKNAAISIVGSYNVSGENDEIAVVFEKIIVNKGALLLDIVTMYAKSEESSISIGKDVASLTVNRSKFIDTVTEGPSKLITTNSSLIKAANGFKGKVYMDGTSVLGFKKVIYLESGSVEVANSTFRYSGDVIHVLLGNVTANDSTFENSRGIAIRIDYHKAEASIFDNKFLSNVIAITTAIPMRNDIFVQNTFNENGEDISPLAA